MQKNILIVEDEAIVALDLRLQLEDEGYDCIGPASTVDDALFLIETNPVDFAVLDVNLNGVSSGAVADSLARRDIPFLYLTGYGDRSVIAGMPEATMLHKPVPMVFLLRHVLDTLSGNAAPA